MRGGDVLAFANRKDKDMKHLDIAQLPELDSITASAPPSPTSQVAGDLVDIIIAVITGSAD